jgi:hypothetical protein
MGHGAADREEDGMTAVLNDLLEEAARRTGELAARAEAGAAGASDLAEQARALGLRSVDEAKDARAGYAEAVAAVQHAANEAREAVDAAGTALLAVPKQAQTAGAAVAELLTGLHDELVQLGALRARLLEGVATSAQQAEVEFHDLARQVSDFTHRLDTRLMETAGHVEYLQGAVDAAGRKLEEARERSTGALAALVKEAAATTSDVGHVIEQVTAVVSTKMVMLANTAVARNNELTARVREAWTDETKDHPDPAETWMETALQPLREAVVGLAGFGPAAEPVLVDALASMLDEGSKAVDSLGAAARSLQDALPGGTA